MVGSVSTIIGMFFGIFSTLIFKSMRFLTYSVVTETFIMYAFALIAYFVAGMTTILDI